VAGARLERKGGGGFGRIWEGGYLMVSALSLLLPTILWYKLNVRIALSLYARCARYCHRRTLRSLIVDVFGRVKVQDHFHRVGVQHARSGESDEQ